MALLKTPLELNPDFRHVLKVLEYTNNSMFITGKAGTGKSTLLQLFRKTTKKKVITCAPTGIAALNIKGQTIHSLFGFPPRLIQAKDIRKSPNRKWFKKIDVLIIDEISMVRADLMDAIDRSLRLNRECPEPFGGVQLIMIGDLFQLPPVIATEEEQGLFELAYDSPYFFSAHVLRNYEYELFELRKVYRQENRHFLRLLEAIRLNQFDYEDLEDLNTRYDPNFTQTGTYVTLSPRNAKVDSINKKELDSIAEPEFTFRATISGEFDPKLFPTEAVLHLKKGAQVMFLKNDANGNYVNGTIGKVVEITQDDIRVSITENGSQTEIDVYPSEWEIIRYRPNPNNPEDIEAEVIGIFEQYPLKLAWAVTIHKSQGKTFDRVIIDMDRGAFEFGQTYVALSRCRTLEGIVLKKEIQPRDILLDERVVDFYESKFR
jgi:ATP-dependent exoDNAse (exonuclease V) alpha subunit